MTPNRMLHDIDYQTPDANELAPVLVGQLNEILEKAERTESVKDSGKAYWHYSVPMAGVRYYGFQAGPN